MVKLQPDARAERTLERRQQLLEAALELMGQRGFANTSVEDLARAAGLAKGTVYLYFETKEALLEALLASQSLLPELETIAESLTPDTEPEALIRTLVETIWQALHTRRATLALFLRESMGKEAYGRLLLEKLMPAEDTLAQHLREKLAAAFALIDAPQAPTEQAPAEEVSATPGDQAERLVQLNVPIYVRCLVISMVGIYVEQELLGGKQLRAMPEEALLDTLCNMFVGGVLMQRAKSAPPPLPTD